MVTRWLRRIRSLLSNRYAVPISLFIFASLISLNSLENKFVLDDRPLIERNPFIRKLERIPIVIRDQLRAIGDETHAHQRQHNDYARNENAQEITPHEE